MCKSLSAAKRGYSNIKREALAILHGLEKFHHYCFDGKINIIKDSKPLVAIFKKDVATLSQRLQYIALMIHQHGGGILHKPGPDLIIADWLSRQSYKENKNDEILGMKININAMDTAKVIPKCMTIQEIQQATIKDEHLHQLRQCIIRGWPESRNEVPQK